METDRSDLAEVISSLLLENGATPDSESTGRDLESPEWKGDIEKLIATTTGGSRYQFLLEV